MSERSTSELRLAQWSPESVKPWVCGALRVWSPESVKPWECEVPTCHSSGEEVLRDVGRLLTQVRVYPLTHLVLVNCHVKRPLQTRRKEMFYLTTHSTHFIYGYMASDIWQMTTQIARKETRCHHMGYSFRLVAWVLLYASSHRQDNTYHGFCYTSHGALAGTRNSSMGSPWRIDPTTYRTLSNTITTELNLAPPPC